MPAAMPHDEFRAMVKAFHEAGLEVWLDVVYNHTCEGDQDGPTYSYRGIDNASYYLLQPDRRYYLNDTGCGNTLRCANAAVRLLVLNSLEYYTDEMHVDGFRFDLASIFTRNADGSINDDDPAIIAEISAAGARARRERDGGSVGHRHVSTGAQLSRPDVASMERPVPRRSALVRQERCGQGPGLDAPPVRQRRSSSPTR